jgi:hypothetical protein
VINSFYRENVFVEYREKECDKEFNKIIHGWINKGNQKETLNIIDKILIVEEKEQPNIPNVEILSMIVKSIENSPTSLPLDALKRDIILSRYKSELTPIISSRLVELLALYPTETDYLPYVEYVFNFIISMPTWLDAPCSVTIGSYAKDFLTRCTDETGKLDSLKVIIIAAYSSAVDKQKKAAMTLVLNELLSISKTGATELDNFILDLIDGSSEETREFFQTLREACINHIWNAVVLKNITGINEQVLDRFQFCYERRDVVVELPLLNRTRL